MIFLITTDCNRNCSYCFEGSLKNNPQAKREMSVQDIRRLMEFGGKRQRAHTFIGGEPTLHPKLFDLIDAVASFGPCTLQLLTNGLCHRSLLLDFARRNVPVGIHLNCRDGYSPTERQSLEENFRALRDHRIDLDLTVTLVSPEDSFDLLYRTLRENPNIQGVRLAIATLDCDAAGPAPRQLNPELGEAYLRVMRDVHRINPRVSFNGECAMNLCQVRPETYRQIEEVTGPQLRRCTGNFDIFPDFHTHFCFALGRVPELRIDNIFEYRSWQHVEYELLRRKASLEDRLPIQCDHAHCDRLRCLGPCIAFNYHRSRETQPNTPRHCMTGKKSDPRGLSAPAGHSFSTSRDSSDPGNAKPTSETQATKARNA